MISDLDPKLLTEASLVARDSHTSRTRAIAIGIQYYLDNRTLPDLMREAANTIRLIAQTGAHAVDTYEMTPALLDAEAAHWESQAAERELIDRLAAVSADAYRQADGPVKLGTESIERHRRVVRAILAELKREGRG